MKKIVAIIAISFGLISSAVVANDSALINDESSSVQITVKGGYKETNIDKIYDQNDLRGFVFGRLNNLEEVSLEDTFCVVDLPMKTITITDIFGYETQIFSSEQNCYFEDSELSTIAKRYIDYRDFNGFLNSLGIETVEID